MNKTRVVAKSNDGELLFFILKDASIEEETPAVQYDSRLKIWSDIKWLAVWAKWIPLNVQEYPDILEVPEELIKKMENYDWRNPN
ncbi:MAG: hypothetical protein WCK35_17670 [Chloroflexota bacterium]